MPDVQSNAFQLTINNNANKGLDHAEIKRILINNFTTLNYIAMADEVGLETQTPHTHIYVHFTSRVRFSTLKKHFPTAHIEKARASAEVNIQYVSKTGKWKNDPKADTSIKGSFEEWGERPKQKGKNSDLEQLYGLIEAGYTNSEIIKENNDYIAIIEKLDRVRTTFLVDKFTGVMRDVNVVYISGETGTGKTRSIYESYPAQDVYRINDYKHPFDSYEGQSIMVFDEFRSQLRISDVLNYLDIYPIVLPARYANKYACYTTLYLISNWTLEQQYINEQHTDPESWEAFLRRVSQVKIFTKDGVTEFNSVQDYFDYRDKQETESIFGTPEPVQESIDLPETYKYPD